LHKDKRHELDEQQWLQDAREGDHEAFKQLVKKYEPQVAATVIGMLGHVPEAEDVGQETFVRFYRSLNKFRGEASVGTYLTRIAINLCLNETKKRKRQRNLFSSQSSEGIENLPDTHSETNQREAAKIVTWGLQKLPAKFKAVLVLRLIDGYSTEETAGILKLPVGTVLSRLARGQQKLREILAPVYQEKNV
jgi:RNA polymerase sigma-70 factor (ECF subfamily)